jgi:CubicO group peptidase (beta-lactamase class C family)
MVIEDKGRRGGQLELGCKAGINPETMPPEDEFARPRSLFEPAYRVLADAISSRVFPGCAFGVLAGGSVILQDALGRFTYDQDAPAVTASTVYDVASITKVAATTTAAMLLQQRGQLDLQTPLGELLPEFLEGRAPGDPARKVRLCHLLAHNSGLPGYVEFFRTAATAQELTRALLNLPLEAEPGLRAEYSDPGFMLLGEALEALMKEPLTGWLQREVFQPLGMTATGFCPPPAVQQSIPPTEEDTWLRHRRMQGEVQDENAWLLGGVAGHAGLFSNVPDLLRLAAEILAAGRQTGAAPLFTGATVEHFTQHQGPAGSSSALGWDTPSENSTAGQYFSPHTIGHLGFSGCSLWIDLEAGIAVALLTNRTWPDRSAATAQGIRQVRPAFHDAVRQALKFA